MIPIPLIRPGLLVRQPCQDLSGLALRMHLMDEHGWTLAMVLTCRGDETYLREAHEKM